MNPEFLKFLIETLGLTPAEGSAEVTEDQIRAALTAAIEAGREAAAAAESAGNATELQTQLTTLQAAYDEIQAKYNAAASELETLKAGEVEKEIDELLAPHADLLSDDAARTALRDLLKTNRDAGLALLKGMKPAAAASTEAPATPPAPMHDPARDQSPATDAGAAATAISALAKKLQSENPSMTFPDAWAKAEKEISARAARGESIS